MAIVVLLLRWKIGNETVRSHANAAAPRVDLRLSTNALTALLGIASIGCCVAMAMPQVHIVAYCGDLGYGVARGAEMLSLMLAFGIISRIGSGFLADRIGGLRTLLIGSIAQGVALLFYLFFDSLSITLYYLRDVRLVPGRHRAELRHHRTGIDAGPRSCDARGDRHFRVRGGHVARRVGVGLDLRRDRVLCRSLPERSWLERPQYYHCGDASMAGTPAVGVRITAGR